MTIRLLRSLIAVADNRTFSAAAQVVHVTHAAISQQMQTLEADLGVSLFNRSTRPPELTPVAHQIVAKARLLVADYDNLVPAALAHGGLSGVIKLGVLPTTLTGLTPKAMAVLKARHDQLGLHIHPGLTGVSLNEIERGNLHAAIVTRPYQVPAGVQFHEIAREPMQLIVSRDESESDPFHLLKTRPYIRFNRNAVLGSLIDNWLSSHHIRVEDTMELESPEAIASMVHANLGVSIVPELAVQPLEQVHVKRLSLGDDAPYRSLILAYREDQIRRDALDALLSALLFVVEKAKSDPGV